MVASSINAYGEHGFNYNLTNLDFSNILNKGRRKPLLSGERYRSARPAFSIFQCVRFRAWNLFREVFRCKPI